MGVVAWGVLRVTHRRTWTNTRPLFLLLSLFLFISCYIYLSAPLPLLHPHFCRHLETHYYMVGYFASFFFRAASLR